MAIAGKSCVLHLFKSGNQNRRTIRYEFCDEWFEVMFYLKPKCL